MKLRLWRSYDPLPPPPDFPCLKCGASFRRHRQAGTLFRCPRFRCRVHALDPVGRAALLRFEDREELFRVRLREGITWPTVGARGWARRNLRTGNASGLAKKAGR